MKLQDFMAIHSHITNVNVCILLKHTDLELGELVGICFEGGESYGGA